jgi:hypothetical protein
MYRSTLSWSRHKLEVSGQLHAPATLPPGKELRYPLDRLLGGPQSQSWRCGEEKILDPSGTQTPTTWSSSPSPVTIPIELSRLVANIMAKLFLCCTKHYNMKMYGGWGKVALTSIFWHLGGMSCYVDRSPSLDPILSEMNPVHTTLSCFSNIHLHIIFPTVCVSS